MRWWFVFALAALSACGFSPKNASGDGGIDGPMIDGGSGSSAPVTVTLTVDLGNGSNDLTDFPLLVELDSTHIDYSSVPDPTTGFTFLASGSGQPLDYDVDHWDPHGTSALWVHVPLVTAGSTPTLTMTYGTGQHAASSFDTWSGFTQVLHFDSPNGGDSVGTFFTPAATDVATAAGEIGSAAGFVTGSTVGFANGNLLYEHWDTFTLELWLYMDYDSPPAAANVFQRGTDIVGLYNTTAALSTAWDLDNNTPVGNNLAFPLRTWTLVAITWASGTLTGYVNGAAISSASGSSTKLTGDLTQSFTLGSGFQGRIDELELDKQQHPNDWFPAEYKSQTGAAVTFGP
ncbi:MAG TPA: LamG-like jellyroll fold domain-containing protein [Kofleriaceae bacterium]|jgi:hypothetical protein